MEVSLQTFRDLEGINPGAYRDAKEAQWMENFLSAKGFDAG